MRRSHAEKAASHERIVEIAAARIREQGTEGPGVAEIMEAAGLTHGGFYKHFGSRDELIAEAVDRTFAEGNAATAAVIDEAQDPLGAFVDWYTSTDHRDNPGTGCGVVALGTDMPRCAAGLRHAYTEQVRRYVGHLEPLVGSRERAVMALSALVGAVLVARAVDDDAASDEILRTVANAIKEQR